MLATQVNRFQRRIMVLLIMLMPSLSFAAKCPCASFENGALQKYIDADDKFSCKLKLVGGGILLTVEARRDVKRDKEQENLVKASAIILHNSKYNGRCTADVTSDLKSDCGKENDICHIVEEDEDAGEVKHFAACYAILHKMCNGVMIA